MATIRSFEDTIAWQSARELVSEIYEVTSNGEFRKDFGLRDQLRRAAISIVSNIAEGFERGGNKEFIQFLFLAKGSCGEVRTQLYLAKDLNYLTEDSFLRLREKVVMTSKTVWGLIQYLRRSEFKGDKYR